MQFAARATPPFLIAFLTGIFFSSYVFASLWFGSFFLLLATAFTLMSVTSPRRHEVFLASLCMLGVALGIFRFTLWDKRIPDAELIPRVNTQVTLVGVVDDEPDVREGNTHLTVALRSLEEGSTSRKVFGSMLVTVPRFPDHEYGDELRITGKLMLPKKFSEEDGRVFDYPSYLASKGVTYQMSFAQIDKTSEGKGNVLVEKLFFVKKQFGAALALALPEPHNALMSGLLLGGKQSLGEVWLERFRTAGIVHIIVLSGYNMTVVATWLVRIFRFTGFAPSLSAGALGIVLFAVMTGAGATVLRAAIMALLALLARATGRTQTMGRALLFAGALMVLQNPSILAFDPSFQLSFLASLGLVYIAPIFDKKTALFQRSPLFREVFITTCATQVAVLPLLLAQTGMLSLVSLPVNLLVLPIIPLTMFFGFVAGVAAIVTPPLAFVAGLPAYVLLSWILDVALYSSRIPFAAFHVSAIPSLTTLFIYALLVLWLVREHRKMITSSASFLPRSQEVPLPRSASDKTEKQ